MDHKSVTGIEHKFTPMVNENVEKYSKYIFEPVDSNTGNWQLVHEDVDMKVYRRELEEDGVVVDPLKAQYIVKGLSGLEMARYFYEKDSRLEWEGTIESFNVLETLAEDTILFHQLHKRIWPSTQRETVFCSHLCTLVNAPTTDNTIGHTWMVCNFSIDHPSVPVTTKHIRTTIHIGMVCQTLTTKPVEPGKESTLTRDDISCKIIYAANVNPGGWAPPSVVRTIAKREITKFIKKISSCALKAISDQPLTL
jgi:collagen type IV alpha-3-binding protein